MKKLDAGRTGGIIFFALLLISIRGFEEFLFYDPLLMFFKKDYAINSLPDMDLWTLYINLILRFVLNSFFSLAILWLVFKNRDILKLSIILYSLFFMVLFSIFVFIILTAETSFDNTILFYIRRFLIHPLLLLILLPAFVYHQFKSQ